MLKSKTMILLFAAIIALTAAAPNQRVSNDDFQAYNDVTLCETPACMDTASFILDNMDSNVDPCDNFYKFACGKFIERSVIPATTQSVGTFQNLQSEIEEQLHSIIPDGIREDDSLVFKSMKTYFETCMDTEQIEKNSITELRKDLKKLGGCPVLEGQSWNETNFDWKKSMYEYDQIGYLGNIFFQIFIGPDPNDSSMRILTIDQAFTEIPHKSLINGKSDDIVKVYSRIFADIFEFLGVDRKQAESEIDSVVDFEIALAQISLSVSERRDATKLNNRMALQQLEKSYPGIPWAEYINEIVAPYAHIDQTEEIIVANPNFFDRLPKLIKKTPKRVLANYICMCAMSEATNNMGKEIMNIVHNGQKALGGAEAQKSRKEVCFENLLKWFYPAIGRLYVKYYFDKNAKVEATNLVENVRNSLYRMIEQADWMDNTTKNAALKKLYLLRSSVGYPDELENDEKINEDYETLILNPKSFYRSELTLKRFEQKQIFPRLREPISESNWLVYSNVAQVNAAYYLNTNSLDLPAGILQGHFYSSDRPNYMNYGAIGVIIGHELSHGFDDEGSQYDEKGNLVNWWKNETREKYLEKAKCIIEQYGNYTVKEVNMRINGINTQGENIADNAGLKAAYLAYDEWAKINSKEPQLPGLHYTPRQMFWISFANEWCEKIRPEALKQEVAHNSHTPMEFRVVGTLSNMPEFSRDFKCPLRSPMNPVRKCSLFGR